MIEEPMIDFAKRLWPFNRSITGDGVRQTLKEIQKIHPEMQMHEVPSGTECYDWEVPKEWVIRDAYVIDPDGNKIMDIKQNNLHLMGYSIAVDQKMSLKDLDNYLYSLPQQPNAIPYVTSYYKERWGFCLTHEQRESLKDGEYHVFIDSEHIQGSLTYGEVFLPGSSDKEVFLSTYVCHPSMANNELSGPVVTTYLLDRIKNLIDRKYSYRIVFLPETIGSILYLSRNLEHLKKQVIAGFNISCVGDERAYSYLPTRYGNTYADDIAKHVLKHIDKNYVSYTFLDRGSDERQYCSPGADLPVASLMRTKYGKYPEYHTSLDDFSVVTQKGLEGGLNSLEKAVEVLENNMKLKMLEPCEPQLGKRGLYPTISSKGGNQKVRDMMNIIAYSDGENTILEIAERLNLPFAEVQKVSQKLLENKLAVLFSEEEKCR